MLICPVCKKKLIRQNKSYFCENNHCYDISKKGYVNLLLSQSSASKIHGDDKLMTAGRRDFLGSGHYKKLLDFISAKTLSYETIVDVGCGEGYYTCGIHDFHKNNNVNVIGIDISKDIIAAASSRGKGKNIVFAVASCSRLPIENRSAECIISVFAPVCDDEFLRILSDDGVVIRVSPGVNHLIELKEAVYDAPQLNDPLDMSIAGFEIVSGEYLKYSFIANNSEIKNLFTMTPYYYKTSPVDKAKLDKIDFLEITAEFIITVYKKRPVN